MTEIKAWFDSRGRADYALSELRERGFNFALKSLKTSGPPEESQARTAFPNGVASTTELTGTNMAVFPLVGGRAMMQLDHSVEYRETELRLEVGEAAAGQVKRMLKERGGRVE